MRGARIIVLSLAVAVAACHHPSPPAPSANPGPEVVAEVEPNDTSRQAQVLTAPMRVRASLAAAGRDADFYRLDAAAPVLVRVEVASEIRGAYELVAFDQQHNRLLRTVGKDGESAVFPNLLCSGTCFFEVAAADKMSSGAYSLTVTTSAPLPTSEREPNNRYVDAQPLPVGGSIDGYLAPADDVDWYFVQTAGVPAGQVLSVTLASPPDVRVELAVVRPSDQAPMGTYRAAAAGEDLGLPDLSLPPSTEKGWYLVVRSAWMAAAGKKDFRASDPKIAYTIAVKALPAAADLETEPNNDAAHATLVSLVSPAAALPDGGTASARPKAPADGGTPPALATAGDGGVRTAMAPSPTAAGAMPSGTAPVQGATITRTGFVAPKGDSDWYTFHVDRPSIVCASVTGVDGVDLVLSVIDPTKKNARDHNTLARSDQGGIKEPEAVSDIAVPAGDDYVVVDSAWKKVDQRWVKDYENAQEPYTLTLNVAPDDGTTEREPNDSNALATAVQVGKDYRGYIQPAGDRDFYKLVLAAPQNVAITVSGVPKLDLVLTVKDADGQVVGTADQGRIQAGERLVVPFTAGTFFLEVEAKDRASNPFEPYTLSLR